MKLKLLAVSLNLASIASEEVSTAAVQSSPAPTTVAPTTATAATANNDQETTAQCSKSKKSAHEQRK